MPIPLKKPDFPVRGKEKSKDSKDGLWYQSRTYQILFVVIFALVCSIGISIAVYVQDDGRAAKEMEMEESAFARQEIAVDVKGAVVAPGMYYLTMGSRVSDAVEKAGGLADNAARDQINLSALLKDGQEIFVPFRALEENTSDSGKVGNQLIDINTATVEELDTLKGIGPAIGQRIVDYREKHGKFQTIEDIKKVQGIGDKIFDDIKDFIVATP